MEAEKRPKAPLSLRIAFLLVVIAIVMLIAIRVLNAISVYPPVATNQALAPELAKGRSDVTEIQLTTEDGVQLYGWVLGKNDAHRKVIAFTGNAEHVGTVSSLYTKHAEALDAQFILFDYRGYGNSKGAASEQGLYVDARTAYGYAVTELKWAPAEVILWGRSLGGGPAIKLAHELIHAESPPRALILEAPFTCISDMAQAAMPHLGKPEWLIYERYDNITRAPDLTVPVFHYQGAEDGVIPYDQGKTLCDALPDHEHLMLDGVGHNNIWDDSERAAMIRMRIDAFLERRE